MLGTQSCLYHPRRRLYHEFQPGKRYNQNQQQPMQNTCRLGNLRSLQQSWHQSYRSTFLTGTICIELVLLRLGTFQAGTLRKPLRFSIYSGMYQRYTACNHFHRFDFGTNQDCRKSKKQNWFCFWWKTPMGIRHMFLVDWEEKR
jgi:hypothetical protein